MESYWKYNQIETLVTAAPPDAGFVPKQIIKILYKYQHGRMYCILYPIKQATIEIFGFQLKRQQSFNVSLFVCAYMSICVVYVSASVHICVFMYMCVRVCKHWYVDVKGGYQELSSKALCFTFWDMDFAVSTSLVLGLQENYSTLDFYMTASNLN